MGSFIVFNASLILIQMSRVRGLKHKRLFAVLRLTYFLRLVRRYLLVIAKVDIKHANTRVMLSIHIVIHMYS